MFKRITAFSAAFVLIITLACARYLPQIRATEALLKTVASDLVARGVITEDKKTKIFKDADDGITSAVTLSSALAVATTDAQKLMAWKAAGADWLAILGRGDFVNVPYLSDAVTIVNGVFDVAIAFYDKTPGRPGAVNVSETDLQAHIKSELKRAQQLLRSAK